MTEYMLFIAIRKKRMQEEKYTLFDILHGISHSHKI